MAPGTDPRRPGRIDFSKWDLIPLGSVLVIVFWAIGALATDPPEPAHQAVRVSVDRNGETGEAVCRRYDVPAELCGQTEIEGNRVVLVLDPDPVRPGD